MSKRPPAVFVYDPARWVSRVKSRLSCQVQKYQAESVQCWLGLTVDNNKCSNDSHTSTGSKPRSGGRRSSSSGSSSNHTSSSFASFVAGISSSVSAENWRIFLDGGNNGNEPSEAHLAARGKPTSDKSNQEATREKLATRGKLASDKSNQKEKEGNKIKVWFAGGSRAASSKAGYGALIYVSDKKVRTVHEFIGAETNHCNAPGPSGIGFQDLKLVAGSKAGRLVLTDLVNLLYLCFI